MIQTSLAKRIALIAAGGLMSCLFAAVASGAAEIKVLTSVALTSAFNELAPNFEQATGNKLKGTSKNCSHWRSLTAPE